MIITGTGINVTADIPPKWQPDDPLETPVIRLWADGSDDPDDPEAAVVLAELPCYGDWRAVLAEHGWVPAQGRPIMGDGGWSLNVRPAHKVRAVLISHPDTKPGNRPTQQRVILIDDSGHELDHRDVPWQDMGQWEPINRWTGVHTDAVVEMVEADKVHIELVTADEWITEQNVRLLRATRRGLGVTSAWLAERIPSPRGGHVELRTVRRWEAGQVPVPQDVWPVLRELRAQQDEHVAAGRVPEGFPPGWVEAVEWRRLLSE